MKNKTILVTGGAGFIGSNLCERLVKDNIVLSLDNYTTGSRENHIDGVRYYFGNTATGIGETIEHEGVDIVYHLGEYSRVEQSFEDYDTVFHSNTIGTRQVLEFVKRSGAKLIYAGSSTKFTNEHEGYVQSPYAWSKKVNTELVMRYGEWFGIDYAITYFYNVYGNREIEDGRYSTLIAKYKKLLKEGKPLPVVMPGNQRRNFTHVNDTVDALILIGQYGKGDEYCIGVETSYTVREVAEMFGGEIEYLPERKGNRLNTSVVTDKTRDLGWWPKQSLKTHIEEFRSLHNL
jgi:UDP-glucose 4-epimerase